MTCRANVCLARSVTRPFWLAVGHSAHQISNQTHCEPPRETWSFHLSGQWRHQTRSFQQASRSWRCGLTHSETIYLDVPLVPPAIITTSSLSQKFSPESLKGNSRRPLYLGT